MSAVTHHDTALRWVRGQDTAVPIFNIFSGLTHPTDTEVAEQDLDFETQRPQRAFSWGVTRGHKNLPTLRLCFKIWVSDSHPLFKPQLPALALLCNAKSCCLF